MTDTLGHRRMLYGRFFEDETVAELSDDAAKLLYLALLTRTDVWGRTKGDALWARSIAFPLDDTKTTQQVEGWLRELHERGLIIRYSADGKKGTRHYIQFPNFHRYQHITGETYDESIYPAPDPDQYPELAEEEKLFRFYLAQPSSFRRGRKFSPEAMRELLASGQQAGHADSGTSTTTDAPELTSPDPSVNALLDRINALSAELAEAKTRLAAQDEATLKEPRSDLEVTSRSPESDLDKRKEKGSKEKQTTPDAAASAGEPAGDLAVIEDEPFTREPVPQPYAAKSPYGGRGRSRFDAPLRERDIDADARQYPPPPPSAVPVPVVIPQGTVPMGLDADSSIERYLTLDDEARERVDAVLGAMGKIKTAPQTIRGLCNEYPDLDIVDNLLGFQRWSEGKKIRRWDQSLRSFLETSRAKASQSARERAARFEHTGHEYVGVPPKSDVLPESAYAAFEERYKDL